MVRPATENQEELSLLTLQSYTEGFLVEAHRPQKKLRDGWPAASLHVITLMDSIAVWPAGCKFDVHVQNLDGCI